MKKFLLLCMCIGFFTNFTNTLSASDEVSISTTRPVIMLLSRGTIRVPLEIKVQNHRDNRWIKLEWWVDELYSGGHGFQLNNPTAKDMADGSHERFLKEVEYVLYTDYDFQTSTAGAIGLLLPIGQYKIKVIVTRIVDGKEKEFTSMVEVTIGLKDDGGNQ